MTTTLTATSNSTYGQSGKAHGDVLLDVAPRLRLQRDGARLKLSGEVGANAVHYARGTLADRLLPNARLSLESQPVEQWLRLDANAAVEQSASDAFAGQPEAGSSLNQATTKRLRVAPAIDRRLSPTLALLARSEHAWTRRSGDDSATSAGGDRVYQQQQLVRLSRQPLPFGGSVEYSRDDASYGGDSISALELEAIRLVASYAVDPELVLSLVAGHERSAFLGTDESDAIYGARLQWSPTERTELQAAVERRFMGTGWNLQWQHRSPFVALTVRASRQPVALSTSQRLGSSGGDTASLLDAILTTRHPDPVQRRQLVQDMIARLGLPAQLLRPVELFSNYAQLEQDTSASLALLGRRTTLTATLYVRKLERLRRADDPLADLGGGSADNEQRGIAFNLNRRLSATTQADLGLSWARVVGQGLLEGSRSHEKVLRAGLHHNLSPQTQVSVGLRRALLDSSVTGSAQESAGFVGLGHRF
ncbi:TIGR03016 family PEP-CTERM system-associated outer membrane protein [Eleftheria terrae]|uniref:TIGR03016 family PEP-CTERM system-associated outer membrane protein n=1 Tax=Eleftheria terrae TaxID=1597781 RepID=UPI00263ADD91|nr:TIGR03016 family PEP-CTERM system-associated outer membrane protein [Eleftheria terrae]WKB53916.1 TIGR03016 family PEP-CTERM system-associated outer membrane protein [Eleftheria terrae]